MPGMRSLQCVRGESRGISPTVREGSVAIQEEPFLTVGLVHPRRDRSMQVFHEEIYDGSIVAFALLASG